MIRCRLLVVAFAHVVTTTLIGGPVAIRGGEPAKAGEADRPALAGLQADDAAKDRLAMHRGLQWLARQQTPRGNWALDPGLQANDPAATALALLPFLAVGETHKSTGQDHPYARAVERGLRSLVMTQKADGDFGGGMYAQGLATWALCEAYRLSRDPILKRSAQRAVQYLVAAQHEAGGWRYLPRQAGDLSVTSWQILALDSARRGGLQVPDQTFTAAKAFLDSVENADGKGFGYIDPGSPSPTMTAAGIASRLLLGQKVRPAGAVDVLVQRSPTANFRNIYYYHWATRALARLGGMPWRQWEPSMRHLLLTSQEQSPGELQGSWTTQGDSIGQAGGRLMVTSLSLLTLTLCHHQEFQLPRLPVRELQPGELATYWADLADPDFVKAQAAMANLIAGPRQTPTFLHARLQPVAAPDAQQLGRLIADLDAEDFQVRQQATGQLEQLRELARPSLMSVLQGKPTLEMRQRAERLLQRLDQVPAEALRPLRAITVLERLEAEPILEKLASGAPAAWQTQEAKAALDRLRNRPKQR